MRNLVFGFAITVIEQFNISHPNATGMMLAEDNKVQCREDGNFFIIGGYEIIQPFDRQFLTQTCNSK